MNQIVVVGNSAAAREIYEVYKDGILYAGRHSFKGFLSYKEYKGDLRDLACMFLGDCKDYLPDASDRFVVGIGRPEIRLDAFSAIRRRGGNF